jgi:methyltransferase family protein
VLERSLLANSVRVLFRKYGYLAAIGWPKSARLGEAVDAQGRPVPWITYPAVAFLEARLNTSFRIFEYGSGNSTLWWAARVARVDSCEHDRAWSDRLRERLPGNVRLRHVPLENEGQYSAAIGEAQGPFDIVVIDGPDRVKCARHSLPALGTHGVIVWDDTQREEYEPGFDLLRQAGFRRLDFHGLAPIMPGVSCTSIFYRVENCLGI